MTTATPSKVISRILYLNSNNSVNFERGHVGGDGRRTRWSDHVTRDTDRCDSLPPRCHVFRPVAANRRPRTVTSKVLTTTRTGDSGAVSLVTPVMPSTRGLEHPPSLAFPASSDGVDSARRTRIRAAKRGYRIDALEPPTSSTIGLEDTDSALEGVDGKVLVEM